MVSIKQIIKNIFSFLGIQLPGLNESLKMNENVITVLKNDS